MSKTKKAPLMIRGTDRNLDYLVFARTGNVALSVKVNALLPGSKMGVPNTVWFGARLRASDGSAVLPDPAEVEETNVVALKPKADAPTSGAAWPDIVWEKDGMERSSTTIGVYLRGGFGSMEEAAPVIEDMKGGKLSMKMADYLISLCRGGEPILTTQELADQLDQVFFNQMVEHIEKNLVVSVKMSAELEGSIGSFGMQAALLKKVYAETGNKTQVADLDDATDVSDAADGEECPECGDPDCDGECLDDTGDD